MAANGNQSSAKISNVAMAAINGVAKISYQSKIWRIS